MLSKQELKDLSQDITSMTQNVAHLAQLEYRKKHIQVPWHHLERLENAITLKGSKVAQN